MGQCVAVCNIIKKQDGDIKMDKLNKDSDVIADKYIVSPYFPKIIYLQHKIKHFLHGRTGLIFTKKPTQKLGMNKNTSLKNENNNPAPFVGIQNPNQQVQGETKQKKSSNNSSIIIPSVKPEFKDSSIFQQDGFLKGKNDSMMGEKDKDPRHGPFDSERRKYPKIVEADSSYEGEWKNGKRDGLGILWWKSVSKFIGEFQEDKVIGFGKLWHEDGDVYIGYWYDFQAQGVGIYKTAKEASYEGFWSDDKQNGFGMEKWPRGSCYIGEYVDGNKQGYGVLNFENNGGYEGEFVTGCISGLGVFYFKDGRRYEGEWKNNKMHGHGMINWPDGKFYEGQFYDDKKEGFGVFYSHKKIYMGIWKNSILDGEVIVIEGGKVKKQFWENGKASRHIAPDKPIIFEQFVEEVIANKQEKDNQNNNCE